MALVRARTATETDLMLPQVLDANDDGTVYVDPTFVRELAALVAVDPVRRSADGIAREKSRSAD